MNLRCVSRHVLVCSISWVAALLGFSHAYADFPLEIGMAVEIDLDLGADGSIQADDVVLLPEPRSTKLRGELRAFDPGAGSIQVLDWTLEVDERTRWSSGSPYAGLEVGRTIEVKVQALASDRWRVREVETEDVKNTWKIKGVITGLRGDTDDLDSIEVGGLSVAFVEGTDVLRIADRIAEDLFRDLKEEETVTPRLGASRRRVGDLQITGSLRHDLRRERDHELRRGSERDISEPSLRLELATESWNGWKLFSQLRWTGRYALRERGLAPMSSEDELSIRQLYLSGRDIGGLPVGLVMGKQRVQDDREVLLDEYLDAVRVYFYGVRPLVLEASFITPIDPASDKFSTWNDWLLQARLYPGERWKARAFALLRNDTSSRQRDVRYFGVGVHGRQGPVKAWFDASRLGGEDKGLDQEAWSMDLGAGLRARNWPMRPSIWAGFAVASGDEDSNDTVSNKFRQSGYEDNSSRVWGIASFLHYGELLDPELSNLRVLSLGASARPYRDVSVEIIAHRYRLDRLDDSFDDTDLNLGEDPLDGQHASLGHELDLIVAWRNVFDDLHVVGRLGRFSPGEAFAPTAEAAWLQRLELRWDF